MEKRRKILVLGYFGYRTNQLDGQTVKTRTIFQLLTTDAGNSVTYFDTQSANGNRKALFSLFRKIISSRSIAYLPARRNLTYIFPLLFIISLFSGSRISYFVIGGWLPGFVNRNRLHRFLLKRIRNIFVETQSMKQQLDAIPGFSNVKVFPNFRLHDFVPEPAVPDDRFRLVFMSRVTRLKGVDVIFRLAEQLAVSKLTDKISIDFYGPMMDAEKEWFFGQLTKYETFISYKGLLQPEQIFDTLSGYDAMLFPTRYPGEGCPGAIIDSYISGIPVIASDWKYNSEFVEHNVTGFLFQPDREDEFHAQVMDLYNDRVKLMEMKRNALRKSREYSSAVALEVLSEYTL